MQIHTHTQKRVSYRSTKVYLYENITTGGNLGVANAFLPYPDPSYNLLDAFPTPFLEDSESGTP